MINIKFIKRRYKFILVVVVLISTSIVSAAYSQTLTITGDGHIRVDADVRITGLKATSQNGGIETYNGKYGKESVYLYTTLSNDANSKVTYTVTIHNKTEHMYIIYEMDTIYSNSNDGIECSVDNELKAIGKGIPKNTDTTIDITCKYKNGIVSENKTQITTINFTFKRPTADMVSYNNSTSKSQCNDVQCALDDLYSKLK